MQTLQENQQISSFLGSLYLCKPIRQVLDTWRQLLPESVPAVLNDLFAALRGIDPSSHQAVDALIWEYTRLFIGPYKLPAPPWESVYTSPKRLMMQEAHDQVQECYREAGFQIEQEGLMADHIGLELTFLSMLYEKMIESPDQMDRLRSLLNKFIANHLMIWVPQFADDLEKAAELPFYAALAQATREFILSCKSDV